MRVELADYIHIGIVIAVAKISIGRILIIAT